MSSTWSVCIRFETNLNEALLHGYIFVLYSEILTNLDSLHHGDSILFSVESDVLICNSVELIHVGFSVLEEIVGNLNSYEEWSHQREEKVRKECRSTF